MFQELPEVYDFDFFGGGLLIYFMSLKVPPPGWNVSSQTK